MERITRLDRLARLGYFARAVVYALFGYLAVTTSALAHKGPEGEFQLLRDVPAGKLILLALAAGLAAYGLYKLLSAVLDTDRNGDGVKGLAVRLGLAIGGGAYLTMCWFALHVALGGDPGSNEGGSKQAAAAALHLPLGRPLLLIAGFGLMGAAAFQLRSAATGKFMKFLEPGTPPFARLLGRIGLIARAVLFTIIAWSIIQAAWKKDDREIHDLGGALASLRDNSSLYLIVAVGLIVFAAYSLIEARYRIVPRIDPMQAARI